MSIPTPSAVNSSLVVEEGVHEVINLSDLGRVTRAGAQLVGLCEIAIIVMTPTPEALDPYGRPEVGRDVRATLVSDHMERYARIHAGDRVEITRQTVALVRLDADAARVELSTTIDKLEQRLEKAHAARKQLERDHSAEIGMLKERIATLEKTGEMKR